MPKALKDFLSVSAIVGALFSFFVFASSRWINEVDAKAATSAGEIVTIKVMLAEIKGDILTRLERIERKIDRMIP